MFKGFLRWRTSEETLKNTLTWKTFPCNWCPKTFSNGGDLKTHLRIHSDEKPFPCNQCPKAFLTGGNLKTHLRTHSGEKPYPCNQCYKAFSHEEAHKNTHR